MALGWGVAVVGVLGGQAFETELLLVVRLV